MIFKLEFNDRTDFAQAKSELHLLQSYESEYSDFQEIIAVEEIEPNKAKEIMIKNLDYEESDPLDAPEFSLYDLNVGDDFAILGSTDYE